MPRPGRRPRERRQRPLVVMAGPGPQSAGGVWSVIETVLGSTLDQRFEIVPVVTHRDGPPRAKAGAALAGFGRIVRLLARRNPPDLVWLHTASDFSFRRKAIIAALAELRGVPYVAHVHGAEFHLWYRDTNRLERAIVRRMLRRARRVIALSPIWEQRLQAIAPCRTVSVMNPVALPPAADRGRRVAERVVSTGRLGDRKGSRMLVRAVALLAARGIAVDLHLAGDGEVELVRAEAARLGVAERVTCHSWLDRTEVGTLLNSSSVFALPSRQEGVPVSLLEAMAHSLPVVVTPVGGIPDLVSDGEQGLIVPVDDPAALAIALERLLEDAATAARMGAAGRAAVAARAAVPVFVANIGDVLDDALS